MFTIIGGDGKEYGPVSVEQIRAWITGGRANLETKAKALGSDEWRRLGDFAEFSAPESVPPPVMTADGPTDLADRILRLGAWFIDNVFAFVCLLPGMLMVGFTVLASLVAGRGDLGDTGDPRFFIGCGLLGLGALVVLGIQVWLLTTRGQTLGKRLIGVRIVRIRDGGNPGFVGAVILRSFIPGLIGAIPWIGFIFTLVDICFIFRSDRRCIHDLIAGTRVVKV